MSSTDTNISFGPAAVHLLRGVLYRDRADVWEQLLRYRGRLEEYFDVLGLNLFVDEAEGYAYLRQREEPETDDFPRLMSRRSLSYPQTLLLVLLRKRLMEFESAGDESRLVLSEADLIDLVRSYWDELDTNERKREDQIVSSIKKLVAFQFLEELKGEKGRYAVRRIIKAYLPVEELARITDTLRDYHRERFGAGREVED
jgi:hypothetical protein